MKTNKHIPISRRELESIRNSGNIPAGLDDFEREALEGWLKTQAPLTVMKPLDSRFGSSRLIYFSAGLGLLGLLLAVFWWFNSEAPVKSTVASKPVRRVEVTDFGLPENIARMHLSPDKKQVKAEEIIQYQLQNKPESASQNQSLSIDEVYDLPPEEPGTIESVPAPVVEVGFHAKEIYLSDLLTVDYREYRSRPAVKTEQVLLTGTPADQEGNGKNIEDQTLENVEIPYFSFLKKTMAIFAKGNYKKALFRYEEILASYPDDLNANFYGGLSYYNLGQYNQAQSCFERCLKHPYNNFIQEASWYLSKTLWDSGRKEEARSMWKQIAAANGFYASIAQRYLKEK